MSLPGFNFNPNSSWEKLDENFSLMANVKPIKGCNSKSYRPLALILVYTIHQPTVHVCIKSQLYSFHNSWEIYNDNKMFSLMVYCKTY